MKCTFNATLPLERIAKRTKGNRESSITLEVPASDLAAVQYLEMHGSEKVLVVTVLDEEEIAKHGGGGFRVEGE